MLTNLTMFSKLLSQLLVLCALSILFLGISIMLIVGTKGENPDKLASATLALLFLSGGLLVYKIYKNRGIN